MKQGGTLRDQAAAPFCCPRLEPRALTHFLRAGALAFFFAGALRGAAFFTATLALTLAFAFTGTALACFFTTALGLA